MLSTEHHLSRPQTVASFPVFKSAYNNNNNNNNSSNINSNNQSQQILQRQNAGNASLNASMLQSHQTALQSSAKHDEQKWRDKVSQDIRVNTNAMIKSDKHVLYSKIEDPLTNLREVLAKLSNAESFRYMRQCRLIVAKLRKCWVEVNEEIKPLIKSKEFLESAIEHIRKDIIVTQETIDNRVHRSKMEPCPDTVDNSLGSEKQSLLIFKKSLESILKPIQEHLQKLDSIRETTSKLCKERAVVTDLICQCLTQSIRAYDRNASKIKMNKSQPTLLTENSVSHFGGGGLHQPHQLGGVSQQNVVDVGPLSAFTEEPINVIREAGFNISHSKEMRMQSKYLIREALENIRVINKSVNDAFVGKIEETIFLNKSLCVGIAENQLAGNRATRWQDLNTLSYKYTLGPEKSMNLNIYERLDRPIIKNFQKHPGNQVPEAQEIQKGSEALKKSVEKSEKNIKTLKVIGQRMDQNMKEKEAQHALDSQLLRRRRELNDHRWVPQGYVKEK